MADEFNLSGLESALGVKPEKSKVRLSFVGLSPQEQLEKIRSTSFANPAEKEEALKAWNEQYGTQQPSGFSLTGLESALQGKVPQAAKVEAPPAERMFEPKTETEQKLQSAIQSVPGIREASAFANQAAATMSKSVSAVQQLVGQYFPGIPEETRKAIAENAAENIRKAETAVKPLEQESPKAALAGEVAGYIVNPVNKLVPGFGGPAQSLGGAAFKGAAQGVVANVLTQPVISEEKPFTTQKIEQATTGGVFGGAFGAGSHMLGAALDKGYNAVRNRFGGVIPENQLDDAASKVLQESGIDPGKVHPDFFKGLQDQAKDALRTGDLKTFKGFAQRYALADELGIPMLRSWLTRDPMQWGVEHNLRGIQGVGEPVQKVMQEANKAFIQRLDDFGAASGADITKSGFTLRDALRKTDEVEAQKVKDAYSAYRQSTGRSIDVPLQGLAHDYARVRHDFGADQIPSGVRNHLDELGLLTGKQNKVFTIDDAQNLIKLINRNYDPAKQTKSTISALDDLRASINNAVYDAGANLPGEAGAMAKAAKKTAQDRFTTIESIPALRDALKGKEPDKFIDKYILRGNVEEIKKTVDYLSKNNPETLTQLQNDVLRFIKNRTTNNVSDENAKFSQAQLKAFVSDEQMASRLSKFLSKDQWENLKKLNKLAEYAYVEPAASAANRSNTASAAANIVKSSIQSGVVNDLLTNLAGIKFPGVATGATALKEMNQRARANEMISQAINPAARPAQGIPIQGMVRPGVAGAGLGVGTIQQRNRELESEK